MTIILDTPEQINMWVLLSRRSQLHLHLKGYKVAGILKWCKANIPAEYGKPTNARNALEYLNDMIGDLGGPEDKHSSYRLFDERTPGVFLQVGEYSSMEEIQARSAAGEFRDVSAPVLNRFIPKDAFK